MKVTNLAEDTEGFTGNVWLMENSENVLIDTGTDTCWERILKLENVEKVVITHSHYDHVDNLPKIMNMFDAEIYAYEPGNLPVDAEKISEDDALELAGEEFRILHTPGHKNDSICLYSDSGILFTGDLIFPDGSFGRTDLDEGDRNELIESIEKIADLDVKEMYCGHEEAAKKNVNDQIKQSLEEARKRESKY
ncbi:MAG: MBL fold metallo-hydrolase [Candidatus Nanohaloarchaea archaeon]